MNLESLRFEWAPIPHIPPLERTMTERGRMYIDEEGNKYFSVTTWLGYTDSQDKKDSLEEWRNAIGHEKAAKISKDAVDRGNEIHRMMEDLINNKGFIQSKTEIMANYSIREMAPKFFPRLGRIFGSELQLYSKKMQIAGTVDLIAEFDGKLAVIDYKGSTKHKEREWIIGYFLQTLIYAFMWYELTGKMPELLVVPIFVSNGISTIYTAEPKEFVAALSKRFEEWEKIKHALLG